MIAHSFPGDGRGSVGGLSVVGIGGVCNVGVVVVAGDVGDGEPVGGFGVPAGVGTLVAKTAVVVGIGVNVWFAVPFTIKEEQFAAGS